MNARCLGQNKAHPLAPGGDVYLNQEGILIGAIGVSGSSVENDHAVAAAGSEAVGVSTLPDHPWRT